MIERKINLTQDQLKSLLTYDVDTGKFKSIDVRIGRKPLGGELGYKSADGYIRLGICGKYFPAHRLAWLYMTGKWPEKLIDHINNVKDDNRWCNLREATHAENNRNKKVTVRNVTGAKGVSKRKDGKFTAYVCVGTFDTVEEAKAAYDKVAKELYGEFYKA